MDFKPKVALSQDFVLQLAKLPNSVQSKVVKWAAKFQADPTSSGINYENIHKAKDPNMKSVRIDQDVRGIVFKPSKGDVYVLLHVGNHDDAYRWAETKRMTINPVTGAMQLLQIESAVVVEPAEQDVVADTQNSLNAVVVPSDKQAAKSPFADLSDTELMSLGVPAELLSDVRSIVDEAALDVAKTALPVEAYEALFLILAGDTVSEIISSRETRVDKKVDLGDYAAALETPESQSRFYVISDDEALMAVMNAPLEQWRVFLHPTQHKLAKKDFSGPARVLGGAGTGKTVLAMHRAKWLAEQLNGTEQKVLFTTFTKNLARDIEYNLRTLCSAKALAQIEVKNLDAWVYGYLRSKKFEHRIVYDRKQEQAKEAWEAALTVKEGSLGLSDEFLEEELEQVVLAQGITTLDEYRIARRPGRGQVLSRKVREQIWPVFEEYRGQLASRKLKEVDDAYRECALLVTADVEKGLLPYTSVVIDETQDFGPQALKLLRAIAPAGNNDLFFVGDGHQRIYTRNKAVMGKCGIDIRGRARKLYLNYRTTDEIRKQAVALLEGCSIDDLDDGTDESKKYKSLSHGPVPELKTVDSVDSASAEIDSFYTQWLSTEQGKSLAFCVICPNRKVRDALEKLLRAQGHRCLTISAEDNHTNEQGVIHLATMHRAKGLEFDCVAVVVPKAYMGEPSQTEAERKLVYVALTRAKRGALLLVL